MKPKIVSTGFEVVDVQPGTYYWCACGQSSKQPFCDGSHKGTGFEPRKFEVQKEGRVKLCLCKHTKSDKGFCDGSHNSL